MVNANHRYSHDPYNGIEDMKYLCSFLLLFACAFSLSSLSSFAYAEGMGGAGGSWGNDSGFDGNGGSTGGGGSGGSWTPEVCSYFDIVTQKAYPSASAAASAACSAYDGSFTNSWFNGKDPSTGSGSPMCSSTGATGYITRTCSPNPEPEPPPCPAGTVRNSSGQCVPELKCPAGYIKQGDKCIWQCPAGYKMLGGNCVKDDMPEDCDPTIQQCDENGEPVCDCCDSLGQLVNQNNTIINNDNRIISLTENITSTLNTTNNTLNTVNNNLNTVNTSISTVNNSVVNLGDKIDNVITAINNNKPDFDTSGIEAKLDAVIQAINNQDGVDENGNPIDLSEIIRLLTDLNQNVLDNKFDDTQLNEALDTIINEGIPVGVNLDPITERQDEQTGLLEQIRDLLRPTISAELAPQLEDAAFDPTLDPWSSIRSFDIDQNMINAQALCPADSHGFSFFGKQFTFPMDTLCGALGQLSIGFMFLAYIGGAFIIVKGD